MWRSIIIVLRIGPLIGLIVAGISVIRVVSEPSAGGEASSFLVATLGLALILLVAGRLAWIAKT